MTSHNHSVLSPQSSSHDLSSNILRLNIFAFLKMALFPMAIITLFWKEQIGLSLTEILVLQAIFSLATLLLEYPSGYISDRLGYRFALNLACLLGIIGWTCYTLADSFGSVLLAEILLGISYAFISGADSALLYETLRADGQEQEYTRFDGRMTAWAQGGEACGAIFAGVLYAWMPLLPFLIQIGVWLAALGVCRGLREAPNAELSEPPVSHLSEAWRIARKALFDSAGLRWSLLLAASLGLASFYPVWLIQPFMLDQGVPLAWFGPIWAVANLTVSLGSLLSHRLLFHIGPRLMTAGSLLLIAAGYCGLGLSQTIWGFSCYFLLTIMRGLNGPFLRHCLQLQSSRQERASILSLKSLLFRLGFVITGPLVGMLADARGLQTAFLTVGVILTVLLVPIAMRFLAANSHSLRVE